MIRVLKLCFLVFGAVLSVIGPIVDGTEQGRVRREEASEVFDGVSVIQDNNITSASYGENESMTSTESPDLNISLTLFPTSNLVEDEVNETIAGNETFDGNETFTWNETFYENETFPENETFGKGTNFSTTNDALTSATGIFTFAPKLLAKKMNIGASRVEKNAATQCCFVQAWLMCMICMWRLVMF